ncbi:MULTISPECIES: IclR family transcriptional regulator [Halorussus]|uniref:IclR family transcriptional regulator n=1 Tax=Halorussus TaxID=1070314 RepID=UPI0013B421C2|nr:MULTISPECIES: IclR family transcriptional regulator [Halorussus]NHN61670.1 IclR family transcriptional regulator [Halorussus sp. JP-T4]
MNRRTGAGNTVQSVETAFSIIELLRQNGGAGVTEIADELDMSKGAIHRYLVSLCEQGSVVKEDGIYRLGLRFLDLGQYVQYRHEASEITEPKVEQLAEMTGERAQFIVEERGKGVYLHLSEGENAVSTGAYVGKVINLTTAASGKAILAHLPNEEVEEILDHHGFRKRTSRTIVNRDRLFEELETVRDQGYAINLGEHVSRLGGIAVPVFGPDDDVLGSLSIGGPVNRIEQRIENEEIPAQLNGIANEIELKLAYD